MDVPELIRQLDDRFSREDLAGAKTLLYGALDRALDENDDASALSVYNELMGFERQYGTDARALDAARAALALLDRQGLSVSRPAAMICLNAATVHKKAGLNGEAAALYDRAETLFDRFYPADAPEFAGLFNNRAALYLDTGDYPRAAYYYDRAARILRRTGNLCDLAVTFLNQAQLANAAEPFSGETERRAQAGFRILDGIPPAARDAYYYYTCRKCAAAAAALGFFAAEQSLSARAAAYYGRDASS